MTSDYLENVVSPYLCCVISKFPSQCPHLANNSFSGQIVTRTHSNVDTELGNNLERTKG